MPPTGHHVPSSSGRRRSRTFITTLLPADRTGGRTQKKDADARDASAFTRLPKLCAGMTIQVTLDSCNENLPEKCIQRDYVSRPGGMPRQLFCHADVQHATAACAAAMQPRIAEIRSKTGIYRSNDQPTRVVPLIGAERWIDTRSVRAVALPRLERQRLGRMPVRAHPGDAHAACEVAISKAHPRAAEAARVELLETETRLERHALQRRARRTAALPQRSRRQPNRAHRSRAAELDGADDRPVAVDPSRPA